ncbi:hypothetical protein QNO00_13930 [Arthrobacter sp. zg-Y1219]|uniref:hypothetical protein n=1 Tax=Arthrobacter sp. zg-Y1219 TaxID=3049067 RepID=UPI0024C357B3|nr:hypothetical protein [Arthrobacter sp. zg-Y1219]MDK1361359.1 hypothetical protein [Arthrobacter sp. zg-Y1219]
MILGVLTLSLVACSPDRLSTGDTCIELEAVGGVATSVSTLASSGNAEFFVELSERSSEVLADELKLIGEVMGESKDEQDLRFIIDAQYDAFKLAAETLNGACG